MIKNKKERRKQSNTRRQSLAYEVEWRKTSRKEASNREGEKQRK